MMPQTLLDLAFSKWEAGDLNDAIRIYTEILGHDRKDVEALYMLGGISFRMGALEQALEFASTVIEEAPHFAGGWYLQAVSLRGLGRLNEAFSAAHRSLELKSETVQAQTFEPSTRAGEVYSDLEFSYLRPFENLNYENKPLLACPRDAASQEDLSSSLAAANGMESRTRDAKDASLENSCQVAFENVEQFRQTKPQNTLVFFVNKGGISFSEMTGDDRRLAIASSEKLVQSRSALLAATVADPSAMSDKEIEPLKRSYQVAQEAEMAILPAALDVSHPKYTTQTKKKRKQKRVRPEVTHGDLTASILNGTIFPLSASWQIWHPVSETNAKAIDFTGRGSKPAFVSNFSRLYNDNDVDRPIKGGEAKFGRSKA